MRVLFMGRKPAASVALRHMVDRGWDVVAVVAPQHPAESSTETYWRPLLRDTARELGIPVVSDTLVNMALNAGDGMLPGGQNLNDLDLVLSFLFWKKIHKPVIDAARIGCFNFHPAPLPEYRGRRGYNFAILEGEPEYGASCHWVSERFDEGDLVEVRRFPIGLRETAYSLEQKTTRVLLEIFDDFVAKVASGAAVAKTPQGPGRSATKRELLEAMRVVSSDSPEHLERKVRAFWYPPHHGAYVEIGGRRYTLVDDETLEALGRYLHGSRERPF